MSRPFFVASPIVATLLAACLVIACDGLKRAEEPGDAGGTDTGVDNPEGSDGGGTDAASGDGAVDAGQPPPDFECGGDEWVKTTKTNAACASRQVKVVDPVAPIDVGSLAIARTPTGRVGIVFNSEEDAETGEMHLVHFTPSTPTYAAPKIVVRRTLPYFHDGYLTKLAASAPDTLSVLSYDMDDASRSGEVHLRKLVSGTEPLTDDLMVTGVKSPTEIAVASDGSGNVVATARISTGAGTAKLASWKKTATGPFVALPDLTSALRPDLAPGAPGIGSASLFVDPGGQAHLLFHYNEVMQHSTPRYHTLAGTTWSDRKTVDNNVIDGLSGFSPAVATFGTKKYAAYFFRKALQSVPVSADLRLATWSSSTDVPQIEILDQQITSDDAAYPTYRVAMAIDKFGLVHLAIVRPSTKTLGYVEYRRQTRVPGGGTKWLSDIVDSDVISASSQALVDLVVDDAARPHIAYRSGKDGLVRYATRFDR